MKVETPQILRNAPLYSIDMLESGISSDSSDVYTHVLVTAGNTNVINMWKVCFPPDHDAGSSSSSDVTTTIFQKQHKSLNNQIDYITSLTRHELSVNAVAFSPDGLHLATAGEAGNIVIWSVPIGKRGNGNGRHYWSTIGQESDLLVRIVSTHAEGVYDISWSADSKRFMVGTIDSLVLVYEDKYHASNVTSHEEDQKESDWQQVFRNGEHTSLVQGVAYDPLGAYLASMGSDRTVRVFPRKLQPKSRKKVLRPSNSPRTVSPPQDHQRMVARLMTESKLDIGKAKRITQKCTTDGTQVVKQRLFVDEANCESFFRRLTWTTDGAYLITPAALWHSDRSAPSFATYLFARHKFDEPCRVLPATDKPSVVVRSNPLLFELPESEAVSCKENSNPTGGSLPHRSIFAVLTLDSVLIYDTHHLEPLSVLSGLHYAGLTDCCWSRDGRNLIVSSSDGYMSIVNFAPGELGKVLEQPNLPETSSPAPPKVQERLVSLKIEVTIPPCEPGQAAVLEGPPAKRAKKTRIAPTLIATPSPQQQTQETTNLSKETERVGDAVTRLSLGGDGDKPPPKKKKRVQPLLVSN
eukprot:CAMPEP_0117012620 /NCGR_PEP_ID=MMETSP0472-20121206/10579_1 /TAXON_ID=693140 ORGANISM="Tiarina fusus, Strain LIS" /NCGR_SAMPLE_ID=MMETSP0472 /ASSEMBLY_ACC=CAM_ASM_000603 /LENGTH=579 /DNA_ID=CAMNT_0004715729 /DNA_START=193 /DNA_END=1935 /DNA_ORIENTATION=+